MLRHGLGAAVAFLRRRHPPGHPQEHFLRCLHYPAVRVPAEKLEVKPAQEEIVKTQVLDFVTRDPRQTAMILKEWLSE